MAYDPELAQKIRLYLDDTEGLTEKKMFGGVGFMLHGNMAAGAHSDGRLMIRCAADDFLALCKEPGAQPLMRGDTMMTGWLLISPHVLKDRKGLYQWLDRGVAYAGSLPPK